MNNGGTYTLSFTNLQMNKSHEVRDGEIAKLCYPVGWCPILLEHEVEEIFYLMEKSDLQHIQIDNTREQEGRTLDN